MIYSITYQNYWECKIEIADTEQTQAAIKEMVEFWGGWEQRLKFNDGNYTMTFIKDIAPIILDLSKEWNFQGILDQFKEMEGYYELNGSQGITLLEVDHLSYDEDDFYIQAEEKEVNNG
jgi:hypothetical protein